MHKSLDEFEFRPDPTRFENLLRNQWPLSVWKIFRRVIMGKWCLHANLFLGNKDMFKNYKRFDFWRVQTADIGGTKPWKINCCLIWKLFKFLMTLLYGLFNKVAGNQDRHKSSVEFGPLVSMAHLYVFFKWDLTLAHWTQVSDRCPLGYLFINFTELRPLNDISISFLLNILSMNKCILTKGVGSQMPIIGPIHWQWTTSNSAM